MMDQMRAIQTLLEFKVIENTRQNVLATVAEILIGILFGEQAQAPIDHR